MVRHEAVEGGLLKDLFDQVVKEAAPRLAALKQALQQQQLEEGRRQAEGGTGAHPDSGHQEGETSQGGQGTRFGSAWKPTRWMGAICRTSWANSSTPSMR